MTISAMQVLMAGALDLLIGDPAWLPHPVRSVGRSISACESSLRRYYPTPDAERRAGALLVVIVVLSVYGVSALLTELLAGFSDSRAMLIGSVVLVYLVATTIATRELISAVRKVVTVSAGDLDAGRRAVSMIVGRDTQGLDERGVLKAAIETLAENLSDGVVAPLFYLAVGGLPLALAYKAVNTLDSMIGYKNDRYRHFGWAAARLDDAANYIPARMTGAFIVAARFLHALAKGDGSAYSGSRYALSIMLRDGRNHTSPNSGVPEAAMAGALRVQLGGASTYGGMLVDKPTIGDAGNADYRGAAGTALALASLASVMATLAAAGAAALRNW